MKQKYRFGKERYTKQINHIWKWQKITAVFGGKRSCLKRIRGYNKGRKEEEVGTLLPGNDNNNVIVNYLFIKLFISMAIWSQG